MFWLCGYSIAIPRADCHRIHLLCSDQLSLGLRIHYYCELVGNKNMQNPCINSLLISFFNNNHFSFFYSNIEYSL